MISIEDTSSPLSVDDIEEVEGRFAIRLPKEIFDFYRKFNGGRPEMDRLVSEGELFVVGEFLSIKYGNPRLTFEATLDRVRHLLPPYLIPIAVGPGGDLFCFSSRDDEIGSIYCFRIKRLPHMVQRTVRLASSFNEFLGKLVTKESIRK